MKHLIIAFSVIISALLFHSSCDRDKAEETFADYDSSVLNTQFSEKDSTISFSFTSKANWEITGIDEDSWISIDPMEGYSGSNELTIVISRNSNPEQRSAHFSIESNNSSLDFTFLLISWWWDIDNFGDLMSEQHPLLLQGYFSSTNVNYPLKIEGGPNAVAYPALLVTTEYEYTFNDDGLPTEVKVAVITYLNFVPETSYSRFELSYIE